MQMDWANWEKLAADRETWRTQLTRGLASGEVLIHSIAATRRENRASRSSNNSVLPSSCVTAPYHREEES